MESLRHDVQYADAQNELQLIVHKQMQAMSWEASVSCIPPFPTLSTSAASLTYSSSLGKFTAIRQCTSSTLNEGTTSSDARLLVVHLLGVALLELIPHHHFLAT
eukprot:scaffold48421_cov15-Tisochrysis_lutea.AAC.1